MKVIYSAYAEIQLNIPDGSIFLYFKINLANNLKNPVTGHEHINLTISLSGGSPNNQLWKWIKVPCVDLAPNNNVHFLHFKIIILPFVDSTCTYCNISRTASGNHEPEIVTSSSTILSICEKNKINN